MRDLAVHMGPNGLGLQLDVRHGGVLVDGHTTMPHGVSNPGQVWRGGGVAARTFTVAMCKLPFLEQKYTKETSWRTRHYPDVAAIEPPYGCNVLVPFYQVLLSGIYV